MKTILMEDGDFANIHVMGHCVVVLRDVNDVEVPLDISSNSVFVLTEKAMKSIRESALIPEISKIRLWTILKWKLQLAVLGHVSSKDVWKRSAGL